MSTRQARLPITLLILLFTLTMLPACASTRSALDGAWECIQPAPRSPDEREIKVVADGHFAFGVPAAGPELTAGGGTCSYDGHFYTETVAYHWVPALVGQTIVFDCTLKGGLWYHKAAFETGGQRFNIDEVWRRIGTPKPDGTNGGE